MNKKIIFSAGGTGGHILPAINLMKHFSDRGYEVLIVTDNRGSNFIKSYSQFKSYILKSDTPTNKNLLRKFIAFFIIINSIIKSLIILKKEKPDLIFGLGGYVSFPISFASKFLNLPLVIYENNLIFGRANKYLSFISKKIFLAKKISINTHKLSNKKIYEVGPILNKNIINNRIAKKNNKEIFTIIVLGGSQGAEIFGKIIPQVIKKIKDEGCKIKIIQQCILSQRKEIENFYNQNYINNYIFEFEENLAELISSADLGITRCGASTTAEFAYMFTPFIAVPLPNSIDNHQYLNARYYEKEGCCWLLEQNKFNEKNLYNLVLKVMKNKSTLEDIQKNMEKKFKYDAYSSIEKEVKEFIKV